MHLQPFQLRKVADRFWYRRQLIAGQAPATATDEKQDGCANAKAPIHLQVLQVHKVADRLWYLRQLILVQIPAVATCERRPGQAKQLPWPQSTYRYRKFVRLPIDSGTAVN